MVDYHCPGIGCKEAIFSMASKYELYLNLKWTEVFKNLFVKYHHYRIYDDKSVKPHDYKYTDAMFYTIALLLFLVLSS
jgi:hypothetical protein